LPQSASTLTPTMKSSRATSVKSRKFTYHGIPAVYPWRRLGDKPSFKEGGMLGTYPTRTRTWAGLLGHHTGLA
jgi:hypothetical protein